MMTPYPSVSTSLFVCLQNASREYVSMILVYGQLQIFLVDRKDYILNEWYCGYVAVLTVVYVTFMVFIRDLENR